MATNPVPAKQKIAILGGGTAAMTAAFELTAQPGWDQKYDVTVYQLGWRLGGKGASGRNAKNSQRIEEHGLHVWGGFYENAFAVMQRCYAELGRDRAAPLATWQQAFKPQNDVLWEEYINDAWIHWSLRFPDNGQLPGDGSGILSVWECFQSALEFLTSHVESFIRDHLHLPIISTLEDRVVSRLQKLAFWKSDDDAKAGGLMPAAPHKLLSLASGLAAKLAANPAQHESDDHDSLIHLLGGFRSWMKSILASIASLSDDLRRM